jgi:glutathione S-transferase
MTDTLTFYTNPQSRGQIVRWMLEEVGAPYDTVLLDYGTTMKAPAYLAINPMGKVPAIKHGDQVVTECAAICAYLADAFPGAGLLPDAAHRGAYYRWLFFAAGPTEQAIINNALGLVIPPERAMMVGYGGFDAMVAVLAGAVEGRAFIAGDHFTAADVYVGSQIDWGLNFGTLPKHPAFEAYVAPLRQRPAYQRAKSLDSVPPPSAAP